MFVLSPSRLFSLCVFWMTLDACSKQLFDSKEWVITIHSLISRCYVQVYVFLQAVKVCLSKETAVIWATWRPLQTRGENKEVEIWRNAPSRSLKTTEQRFTFKTRVSSVKTIFKCDVCVSPNLMDGYLTCIFHTWLSAEGQNTQIHTFFFY